MRQFLCSADTEELDEEEEEGADGDADDEVEEKPAHSLMVEEG